MINNTPTLVAKIAYAVITWCGFGFQGFERGG